MKLKSKIKGVEVRSEQSNGVGKIMQAMICSECSAELHIKSGSGRLIPPEAVFNKARNSGWKPDNRGKHLCPNCQQKAKPMPEKQREMTPKERRQIFREIDDCYDDNNERYVDGFTDNVLAKKLDVPRKWISDIREENFGASGENLEMEQVATSLGRITAELTDAINNCMDAAARAESLKSEAEQARAALDRIKKAVGPHRAA